jgi:serine/threonine protein phosphatase PrpC
VNTDLVLRCPTCDHAALADDEYCETCGMALGLLRDARRHHFEVEIEGAAGVSDRGLVHARNEDAVFLAVAGRATVAVVCDGVSTSAAPQVAAQVAAETAGTALVESLDAGATAHVGELMANALATAASAVLKVPWMASGGDVDAPSCTIAAAVWDGSTITIGWSGDSRAYWFGAGGSQQLTVDHSWAQAQVDAGRPAEDAHADPRAHAITRWLGPGAPDDPFPITVFDPQGRGALVVCSDGLWNYFQSAVELASLVEAGGGCPIDIARSLTVAALERGGHDNVTVVVIAIDPNANTSTQETHS